MTTDLSRLLNADDTLREDNNRKRSISEQKRRNYLGVMKALYPEDYLVDERFCTKEEYDSIPVADNIPIGLNKNYSSSNKLDNSILEHSRR